MDDEYCLISARNIYTAIEIQCWYTLFCFSYLHQMVDITSQYPISRQQEQKKSWNYQLHHLTVIVRAPNYCTALLPSWLIKSEIADV